MIRRVNGTGGFASIVKKGAAEAGSIYVVIRRYDGPIELFGPAPQTAYDTKKPQERLFARIEEHADEAAIDVFLLKERRFDEDLWIVEIEPGNYPASEMIAIMTP